MATDHQNESQGKMNDSSTDIGKLISAMDSLEEAVRWRECKVQEMQQKAYAAHARALAAKDSQRSCATEVACAQEQLSVKQESLRIIRDKRLQLTQELTGLRKAEAETRKELNCCRDKFSDDLDQKTNLLRQRFGKMETMPEGAAEL